MGAMATGIRNGMPEFRPYVYRGTGEDTRTPPELQALLDAEPEIGALADELTHIGSAGEYRAHYRRGEKPCAACKQADSIRRANRADRSAEHAAKRERYAAARETGLGSRDAQFVARSAARFEQLLERAS